MLALTSIANVLPKPSVPRQDTNSQTHLSLTKNDIEILIAVVRFFELVRKD